MPQIIDAYVEQLELLHHNVLTQVKHVSQEHVCVELMRAVLEAQRNQLVTRRITIANVEQPLLVMAIQLLQHVMKQIICVFVERSGHQPQHVHLRKLARPERACVVPQHHVLEVLQLQRATPQTTYVNVVPLHHVLEALRRQRVMLLITFANVERWQIALQTQQHRHAMNQIIDVFAGQLVRQHPDAQLLVKRVSQELACVEPLHPVQVTLLVLLVMQATTNAFAEP